MKITNLKNKIKHLLLEQGLSQSDLAKKIGVHRQVLTNWLSGTRNPKIENLEKIAKALNISVEDLLNDNKNFSDIQINVNSKGTVNQTIQKEKDDLKDKEIALLKKEIELLKKELELRKGRK